MEYCLQLKQAPIDHEAKRIEQRMLVPVILSGGAGTRLWPVSRQEYPKPFMRLPDGEGLLQKTLKRAVKLNDVASVMTITNRDYFFHTRDEYQELELDVDLGYSYVLEPCARNTAPAIAMAAMALKDQEDAVMLVLPADHVIENQQAFGRAVDTAVELAQQDYLVTFGIQPDKPETGYGYIHKGEAIEGQERAYKVAEFVEKPDLATAEVYVKSDGYAWNSGMFCFRPSVFLQTLEKTAPDIYAGVQACWQQTETTIQPLELDKATFAATPADSIDYAVMEKAERVAVVTCDIGWSDVGSWDSVSDLHQQDEKGNKTVGDCMLFDTQECYVHSEDRLVAALGVDGLIIVDTPDALLVADRSQSQNVKKIVDRLKSEDHETYRLHRTVHRPWGTYTVLEEGERFKIKRIVVKPGSTLSLQMHHHRSEHWIVVSGTATVVNGDKTFNVYTDQSTYVPAGNKHRLSNPGITPLVMIEVQSGEYLGEDDIVRFDDEYGRS